jgi:hypothetical protein
MRVERWLGEGRIYRPAIASLHDIQNALLQIENKRLLDALTVKRRRETRGKSLVLVQQREY